MLKIEIKLSLASNQKTGQSNFEEGAIFELRAEIKLYLESFHSKVW